MNPRTLKSIERMLYRMERQQKRGRGKISTAPVVLALALIMADVMLTRLVPMIWSALLPHGIEQVATFRGWPALVWRAGLFCHMHQMGILVAIGATFALSCLLGYRSRVIRMIVWCGAASAIALNAAILVITIQTSLRASASAAGIDLDF